MSFASKVTFGSSIVFTVGIISYVHKKQKEDLEKLHDGVVRDVERQHMRRTANLKHLQEQIDFDKILRAERDSNGGKT